MMRSVSAALVAVCLLVAPHELSATMQTRRSSPNIVMFFIDDLGWADVGFMGSEFYETPNIDRLAASSVVFTDAYSNGPNCAPSRASLMSGQYTPRHGIFTVGDPVRGNHRFRRLEPSPNRTVLDESFETIAEVLHDHGYRTASMGKWHLGDDPTTQGFDVNVAGREWGSPSGGGYHSPLRYPNLTIAEPGIYLTDALTDRACEFISDSRDQPFFLYLTHYAVHTPIQAKQELVDRYAAKQPGQHQSNAKYAAMIQSVDESVGRVLKQLDDLELTGHTVVIFFSDNGGHSGATSNHPLRGAKGMLYEGGIRVPLTIRWPGVTAAGGRCAEPVMGIDLYPTLAEIAGAKLPDDVQPDGRSLVSLLRDPSGSLDRDAIFWHFPCYLQGKGDPGGGPFRTTPAGAIRAREWKLIEWFETGHVELYRIADDPGEQHDLAEMDTGIRDRLLERLRQWRSSVNAPVPTMPNPRFGSDP